MNWYHITQLLEGKCPKTTHTLNCVCVLHIGRSGSASQAYNMFLYQSVLFIVFLEVKNFFFLYHE